MQTNEERIAAIEEEIRETPYHKATQHHIGRLRARIARLREEIVQKSAKGKSGGGGGFAQRKYGDATVILVGFPSVGKSTLLNRLTNARAKVAAYDFTTLTVIPGMMDYRGAKIQIFDIPGIIGGAAKGRGRGKEILSVARVADLILVLFDATYPSQAGAILHELEDFGIRLNKKAPDISIKKKVSGGIEVISSSLPKETVKEIAQEFRLSNAEIIIKGEAKTEDLIDAFLGNRVYLPCLLIANKIDLLGTKNSFHPRPLLEEPILISAGQGRGLEYLREKIWETLGLIRVFLKPQGCEPDFENPLILREGQTVFEAAQKIHAEMAQKIEDTQIWGPSAKYPGQTVSVNHILKDGDQITLLSRR